ncbi:MAG: class I tRNA ligase family protein [Candidatus Liptonbacteria bacterium]|nr:class I tRNA ligase family protein [Candidatus Liptonbacteria bacterium]
MLEPRYDHQKTEERIYKLWEKSGYFNPDRLPPVGANLRESKRESTRKNISINQPVNQHKSAFTIIMPPPNANGSLHIGHAVFVTLQDIMTRFARMRGKKALWLPGADHAGFETWVVFDKKLEKEGRNKYEIDREQLFKEIWDFTQNNKKTMEDQLRRLGASCDWSREKFTLDSDIVKIVYETFEKLYKDGLIYRGERIVNWCPKHQTSLSDIENQFREQEDPFYYLKYGPFTIATARPETKFGDKYVVMHPDDKRYKEYAQGQKIEVEWINGTITATIVKDKAIDMKFGTGVMTITPWHDATDFEIAERHKLEKEQIIDFRGKLLPVAGEFAGMHIKNARLLIIEKLVSKGLLVKTDEHYKHSVRVCYKCNTAIEPQIKSQWFIRMTAEPHAQNQKSPPAPMLRRAGKIKNQNGGKSLRDLGVEAVKSKKIKLIPRRTEKTFFNWMKNLRDWNISRQITWGIRIPAWYCITCGKTAVNPKIKANWFLIRHGETDWNKEGRTQGQADVPLNGEGRQQAKKAAETLKHRGIDLIISSDLGRCRETAEIIREATGAEVIFDKNLRERHLGITQGMARDDRNAMYGDILYTHEGKPPGGESFKELEERVWESFKHHKKSHHHKNILIVTHGGPIRTIIKNIKKWTIEEMLERDAIENAKIVELTISDPCSTCGGDLYEQDPDVFDTWFSSGQWPFATLMATSDKRQATRKNGFKTFYPTDVMETGYDILFLWVARMIMLGLYRTGEVPFKTVYLHGLVLDKDRQKMSKSKGNVIDPLGVAELYGADALRMALVAGNTAGRDIVISEEKIRGYRNFATKIWNIARFVQLHKPAELRGLHADQRGKNISVNPRLRQASDGQVRSNQRKSALSQEDRKNIEQVRKIKAKVATHIEKFEFHLAAETVYHYIWHTLADKIIEDAKARLNSADENDREAAYQTLETLLLESLKMLHPFMPFVTEEIYRKFEPEKMLMVEKW